MKILIFSQYFWPESFRINEIARDLQQSDHEVEVLTGKPNYPEGVFFEGYGLFKKRKEIIHGVTVIRIPVVPRGKGGTFRLMLNYFSFAIFLFCYLTRNK